MFKTAWKPFKNCLNRLKFAKIANVMAFLNKSEILNTNCEFFKLNEKSRSFESGLAGLGGSSSAYLDHLNDSTAAVDNQ